MYGIRDKYSSVVELYLYGQGSTIKEVKGSNPSGNIALDKS